MPPLSDKELEERLTAAGNSLLQPPSPVEELLPLLDQIEELLSKVEQSPAKSMQDALSPLMKALVKEDLLKHSDVDVKVAVASCISEITRITAPEAPYDDEKMKDVFQLIVSSFENLADVSSRSHEKRATILETVAKVRSCVIMLDLECEQMIIEMFQHFLKAIRVEHAEVIFSSMETIMTLVLEESEDISPEILSPILATLKRNNEDVMPIAKKLAERVIQNSADKIRTYLTQAVKSLDASIDDFSEAVASVCKENAGTVRHSNERILKDQPVVERKSTSNSPARDPDIQATKDSIEETSFQERDPVIIKSPKSIVSNGTNDTATDQIMTDANSSQKADSSHQLDGKAMSKADSDDSGAQTPVKLEDKDEHAEVQQVPSNHEIPNEDVHISPSEAKPDEPAKSLDKVKETTQLLQSKAPENETVNVGSPTQSGSLPDESQAECLANRKENLVGEEIESVDTASKKTSDREYSLEEKKQLHLGNKRAKEETDRDKPLTEDSASKNDDGGTSDSEARSPDQTEKLGDGNNKMDGGSSLRKKVAKKRGRVKLAIDKPLTADSASKNDDGGTSDSEARSPAQTEKLGDGSSKMDGGSSLRKKDAKKRGRVKLAIDKPLTEDSASKNDDGGTSGSEARSPDQTEKLGDGSNKMDGGSSLRKKDAKKRGRVKLAIDKDVLKFASREDRGKDTVTSPRSPLKSMKDEGIQEETPKMSTKRKRTPGTGKGSETVEYGQNLVGSKVKVWWPKDRMYYEGVIGSFDAAKKKHKVFYTDGDKEVLNLKKERWEFVVDDLVSDGDHDVEHSSHDASSDMQRKKKGNVNSETSSKRQKMESSTKSKSKIASTKSGGKSKDDDKAESESKDNNSKPSRKSIDGTIKSKDHSQKAKATGKSNVDTAKTSSHSKQDNLKTPKSKGKTPNTGKTLVASETKTPKSSSTKMKETDRVKGKTSDSVKSGEMAKGKSSDAAAAKSREGETKSGKKRRR